MSLTYRQLLLTLGVVAFSACSDPTPTYIACTGDIRPGLVVDVRDSVTSLPAGQGARIVARSATVADTAHTAELYVGGYGLAYEQPGTYTVTVEQDGYRIWTRSGIRVSADACHVQTVTVTARLQR